MASTFRNVLYSGLGATPTTVLTTGSTAKTTIIGLSLTNMTESIVQGSIRIVDPNGGGVGTETSAYFIKEVTIPPNQSLRVINGGEKLILGSSVDVIMYSNTAESLDLVMSFVEIT